ncbi:hypothetical protein CDAR_373401 [Caerostris darwini]|uniref:Uncharacterized protein n=1 Tax=Caerostris darwini TaxID=1538125 RepID=A0AAV4N101_9ARAC|nr:hypothetical protein CDAR_373401 [Caerostris darwini]
MSETKSARTLTSPKVPPTPFPSTSSYQQKRVRGSSLMAWGKKEETDWKKKKAVKEGRPSKDKQRLGLWNVPCGRYPFSPPLLLRFRLGFCWQNKPSSSGSVAPFPLFFSLVLLALLKERIGAPPF